MSLNVFGFFSFEYYTRCDAAKGSNFQGNYVDIGRLCRLPGCHRDSSTNIRVLPY